MTPTQLRAFATVVRLGSVKAAAAALQVSEAAVSLHVGQLRKELGDQLFTRTAGGLAFTPGGLRLASRAVEMLGLQDRTVTEVRQAGGGRRLLRVGASGLFAEYAAPGLFEVFADRAQGLDVELSAHRTEEFDSLLVTRTVDVVIGPGAPTDAMVQSTPFLNYAVIAIVAPGHPMAAATPSTEMLRRQSWLLGPSAVERSGVVPGMLRRLRITEDRQRIFQSHAAAMEEAKRGRGVALTLAFAVEPDLADGSLIRVDAVPEGQGRWSISTLATQHAPAAALELTRFVTTPRAMKAMLRGGGVSKGRFRPAVHVTLWS